MRDSPTRVAPPYITGPTYQVYFGHMRCTSAVTAAAAANAVVECPDGNDCRVDDENPLANLKSLGWVPMDASGRARPSVPFSTPVMPEESSTASVPCHPRSLSCGLSATTPMPYSAPPMRNEP